MSSKYMNFFVLAFFPQFDFKHCCEDVWTEAKLIKAQSCSPNILLPEGF